MILFVLLHIDEPVDIASRLPYFWTVVRRTHDAKQRKPLHELVDFDWGEQPARPAPCLFSTVLRVSRDLFAVGRRILYGTNSFGFYNMEENMTPQEFVEEINLASTCHMNKIVYLPRRNMSETPGGQALREIIETTRIGRRSRKRIIFATWYYFKEARPFHCLGEGYLRLSVTVWLGHIEYSDNGQRFKLDLRDMPGETRAVLEQIDIQFGEANSAPEQWVTVGKDHARQMAPIQIAEVDGSWRGYKSRDKAQDEWETRQDFSDGLFEIDDE